jgi:hypothetical protein
MLDLKTLFVALAVVTTFISLALYFYEKNNKTYPGFALWALGTLLAAFGYVAIFLRGVIPVWTSILIVNGAFVLTGLVRLEGITRFLRGKTLSRTYYAFPVVAVIFAGYFHFAVDSILIRTAALTGWVCLLTWAIASVFIRSVSAETKSLYYAAGVISIIYGVSMLARTVFWILNSSYGILDNTGFNSMFFTSVIVYEIWLGLLIMMMNNQRMEKELKRNEDELRVQIAELGKAMSEVKILKGLLPICSTCKKIRDDQGYWKQLEYYIDEHSEATFTHGICPECAVNLLKEIEELRYSSK